MAIDLETWFKVYTNVCDYSPKPYKLLKDLFIISVILALKNGQT